MQDIERFIELCGGTKAAASKLGVDIRTVQYYRSRNRVPRLVEKYISMLLPQLERDSSTGRAPTSERTA